MAEKSPVDMSCQIWCYVLFIAFFLPSHPNLLFCEKPPQIEWVLARRSFGVTKCNCKEFARYDTKYMQKVKWWSIAEYKLRAKFSNVN